MVASSVIYIVPILVTVNQALNEFVTHLEELEHTYLGTDMMG